MHMLKPWVRQLGCSTRSPFLVRCWKARQAAVGKTSVADGRLTTNSPPSELRPLHMPSLHIVNFPSEFRQDWMAWAPSPSPVPWPRQSSRRKNFLLFGGRICGVFYKWRDTLASVGFLDPAAAFDTRPNLLLLKVWTSMSRYVLRLHSVLSCLSC